MTKAKKELKLNKIIPLVIYPFDVLISFNQTDEELGKVLRRLGVKEHEDVNWKMERVTGVGRTCRFEHGGTMIRLKNFPDSSFDYGCLNHEIFHAVCYIMDAVGMPLQVGVSDEAYAYLIGYLTQEIMKAINKEWTK